MSPTESFAGCHIKYLGSDISYHSIIITNARQHRLRRSIQWPRAHTQMENDRASHDDAAINNALKIVSIDRRVNYLRAACATIEPTNIVSAETTINCFTENLNTVFIQPVIQPVKDDICRLLYRVNRCAVPFSSLFACMPCAMRSIVAHRNSGALLELDPPERVYTIPIQILEYFCVFAVTEYHVSEYETVFFARICARHNISPRAHTRASRRTRTNR